MENDLVNWKANCKLAKVLGGTEPAKLQRIHVKRNTTFIDTAQQPASQLLLSRAGGTKHDQFIDLLVERGITYVMIGKNKPSGLDAELRKKNYYAQRVQKDTRNDKTSSSSLHDDHLHAHLEYGKVSF